MKPNAQPTHYLKQAIMIAFSFGGISVWAQSSSLYVSEDAPSQRPVAIINGIPDRLSPFVSRASLAAVRLPEPQQFAVNDLITIIIRESIQSESESELGTAKDFSIQGLLSAFPSLQLKDLVNLQLRPSDFDDGQPQVSFNINHDFEGEGEYERSDTFTTRLTARIIDIKPNDTLVLEARKYIRSDKESVKIIMTGTCRKEDISANNSVLSTQIYDLHLVKEHEGELRDATKKGLITKFFELLFNF